MFHWTKIFGIVVLLSLVIKAHENDDPDVTRLEETGAVYLQNVMDKLQHEREEGQSVEIMELTNLLNMDRVSEPAPDHTFAPPGLNGPTPNPPLRNNQIDQVAPNNLIQAEIQPITPPPPLLTSDELNAIYAAALSKGATLPQVQNNQLPVAPQIPHSNSQQVIEPASQGVAESYPGYYYYFYPIKSFAGNAPNQMLDNQGAALTPPPQNFPPANMMDATASKAMEPLFMAVTGFVGMALMFIVSVLFLPKLGSIRSGNIPELKEAPNELAVFGKLVFESMDGKDCTERIACEVGRFVRTLRMEKVIKIMEIIMPPNMARQIVLIRKAAVKKEKCNFIPCRFKTDRPPAKTKAQPKPWKKGPSPHDLWMKHFEKHKPNTKKTSQNVWNKKPEKVS